jgi:hypothetical protein
MTPVERYLLLGLRLGRHVDGLVDAYYGPPELAREAERGAPHDPVELAREADEVLELVEPDGWLADQAHALRVYAGVLAGEDRSYADEVEGCYGVRPQRVSEDAFRAAHKQLEELLPAGGSLAGRYELWRQQSVVPSERIETALRAAVAELRARTERLLGLPEGETIEIEAVSDEPWLAFNYYLGGLRSRIAVNVDLPITASELVDLAAHEAYPGHHTEHAWKERLLVRDGGRLEESILLVPTPQSLVAEGIAEIAPELVNGGGPAPLADILAGFGVACDFEQSLAVRRARQPLRWVGVTAALMLHEDGASPAEAQAYIERWAAVAPAYAAKSVEFLRDRTWRAHVIAYAAGGQLCRAYVAGDPVRFRRLLTEQVRVPELLSEAGAAGIAPVVSPDG